MILPSISFVADVSATQTDDASLATLEMLSKEFEETEETYGAYLFAIAHYLLARDPDKRIRSGLRALDLSIGAGRFVEAERMVERFSEDFPRDRRLQEFVSYRYGHGIMFGADIAPCEERYAALVQNVQYRDRVLFLWAYADVLQARPEEAKQRLEWIDGSQFAYGATASEITNLLRKGPSFDRKHRLPALMMSAAIPGLGQAYAGHYFDAIQSATFSFLLGGVSYLAWKYEVVERDRGDRNYSLPVIATGVFSVFYLGNLWNAVNSVNRYNRYHENIFYHGILSRFGVARTDRDYFVTFQYR